MKLQQEGSRVLKGRSILRQALTKADDEEVRTSALEASTLN